MAISPMPNERKKSNKRLKNEARPIEPLTLQLHYIFDEGGIPFFDWIYNGQKKINNGNFRCKKENFIGLQILLLETWLNRLDSALVCPKIDSPAIYIRRFIRSIQNPYPLQWRDLIFRGNPFKRYIFAYGRINLSVQASAALTIKVHVGEQVDHGDHDKVSVIKILNYLKREVSPKDLDLSVIARDKVDRKDSWEINGESSNRGLRYGCFVNVEITYKNTETPIVFWLSDSGISELYPNMDPRISSIDPPTPIKTSSKFTLKIGGASGIPLETRSGMDACLAVSIPESLADGTSYFKNAISGFLENNPIWDYQSDSMSTKRFFNGLGSREYPGYRGLGRMPEGKDWSEYLLDEVMPTGSSAVLLTLPIERPPR